MKWNTISQQWIWIGIFLEAREKKILIIFKKKKKRCHLEWEASGTNSDNGEGAGEFLQRGHDPFTTSHSSMHLAWKQWLHSGMHLTLSFTQYSHKHIEHGPLLGLGNLRLRPSSIVGYVSITGLSKPVTILIGPWEWVSCLIERRPSWSDWSSPLPRTHIYETIITIEIRIKIVAATAMPYKRLTPLRGSDESVVDMWLWLRIGREDEILIWRKLCEE